MSFSCSGVIECLKGSVAEHSAGQRESEGEAEWELAAAICSPLSAKARRAIHTQVKPTLKRDKDLASESKHLFLNICRHPCSKLAKLVRFVGCSSRNILQKLGKLGAASYIFGFPEPKLLGNKMQLSLPRAFNSQLGTSRCGCWKSSRMRKFLNPPLSSVYLSLHWLPFYNLLNKWDCNVWQKTILFLGNPGFLAFTDLRNGRFFNDIRQG